MKERQLVFEVGPDPEVEVRITSGDVLVVEGPAGRVGLSIRGSKPDALGVEQFGDHVQIGGEGRLRGSFRIRLEVPAGTALRTMVRSGDVDVRAPVGDFRARSVSGDITVHQATGRTDVTVDSGDVSIDHAGNDARVCSTSGDVKIGRADDSCSVVTVSGDMELGSMGGDLSLKTTSGDVRVDCCEGGALTATSVSGRLALGIKAGRRVDVDIKTLSGRVDLPAPAGSREGAAGPGGPAGPGLRLVAKTVSGDITVGKVDT